MRDGGNGNAANWSGGGNRGDGTRGDGNRGDRNGNGWSGHGGGGDFAQSAQRTRDHWNNNWNGNGNGNWNGDGHHGDHNNFAHNGRDVPFRNDWWNRHDQWRHDNHWRRNYAFFNVGFGPYYWWGWATGPRISAWFDYGWGLPYWGSPYYWGYGPGSYIYCYNDVIYVNGRWFEPAPLYYRQTVNLATRRRSSPPRRRPRSNGCRSACSP